MRRLPVILALAATSAWAGGGPLNTLVIVNDNSAESLELGQYYQDARGIPERNILHVLTTTNYSIDTAAFSNEIRNPIMAYIANAGLSNQVDSIVTTRGMPYRIYAGPYTDYAHSAMSASMFYDFKSSPNAITSVPQCQVAAGSQQSYYEAERAFTHAGSPSSNRYYLGAVLTSTNLDGAKRLVDRSVAADSTQPTGTVYLFHTPDPRNVQWKQFEEADFLARFVTSAPQRVVEDGYLLTGRSNVMGLTAGQFGGLPFQQMGMLPGSVAEHLTSYGGVLYGESEFQQPGAIQDRALSWLSAGAAGAYGTIVEPCAFTQKFPNARMHYWYARARP